MSTKKKSEGCPLTTDNPRRTLGAYTGTEESQHSLSHSDSIDNPIIIERDATGERFVQIGVTALRDPATGDFLPAEPMYIKLPLGKPSKSGLAQCEEQLLNEIAQIAAETIGRYVKAGGLRAGV